MTAPTTTSNAVEAALTKLASGQQNVIAAIRGLQPPAFQQGRAALVLGTVTITTANVTAASNIRLTKIVGAGTNRGILEVGTIVSGTSFVVNARQTGGAVETGDTSTIYWEVV